MYHWMGPLHRIADVTNEHLLGAVPLITPLHLHPAHPFNFKPPTLDHQSQRYNNTIEAALQHHRG
jgi:hypothetical protein